MRYPLLALTMLLSLTLSGCFLQPYKITIQQGNLITDAQVQRLNRGMRTQQVRNIFGSPLLKNIYIDDRIVYVYTIKPGHARMHERRLVIYFRNDRLVNYAIDFSPFTLPKP